MDNDDLLRDIDELVLSRRHKPPSAKSGPLVSVERELTDEDFARLEAFEPPAPSEASPLARLKFKHHFAARLLAAGMDQIQVSYATGYSSSYLGILKKDPAFAELVDHYQSQKVEVFVDAVMKIGTLGMSAVERIQERLDDDEIAAEIGVLSLNTVATSMLDRSIAPPKGGKSAVGATSAEGGRTSLNVNISFAQPQREGKQILLELEANTQDEGAEGGGKADADA